MAAAPAPGMVLPPRAVVMTSRCSAANRPRFRPAGWECTGENLIVVRDGAGGLLGTRALPAVIRADLLLQTDAGTRELADKWGTEPFRGVDHIHFVVHPQVRT